MVLSIPNILIFQDPGVLRSGTNILCRCFGSLSGRRSPQRSCQLQPHQQALPALLLGCGFVGQVLPCSCCCCCCSVVPDQTRNHAAHLVDPARPGYRGCLLFLPVGLGASAPTALEVLHAGYLQHHAEHTQHMSTGIHCHRMPQPSGAEPFVVGAP